MSRGTHTVDLVGVNALEAESDYDLPVELRVDDGAAVPTDLGPLSLALYDPATVPGGTPGGGFAGELRDKVGGTLLATATVSMRGTRAYSTLTIGTPVDGDTVTLGSTVYTFKTSVASAYDVEVGVDAEESLDNLVGAINLDNDGPKHGLGTLEHPDCLAYKVTAATLRAEAKTGGAQGLAIATESTGAITGWTSSKMNGGTGSAGFLVHFDGEELPASLIPSGTARACVFDVFGLLADASAVKLTSGVVTLHSSSTAPHA